MAHRAYKELKVIQAQRDVKDQKVIEGTGSQRWGKITGGPALKAKQALKGLRMAQVHKAPRLIQVSRAPRVIQEHKAHMALKSQGVTQMNGGRPDQRLPQVQKVTVAPSKPPLGRKMYSNT